MAAGTVVFLNGASSSGKTTLIQVLQKRMEGPVLNAGLDQFLWMLPGRYLDRPLWDDVLGRMTAGGATGHRLITGMHRAIAALSLAGNPVLADHVLVESAWVVDLAQTFAGLPAYLVGVTCPLAVLEERERARKDRTLGQARAQFEIVHRHGVYDLVVDTAVLAPEEAAGRILAHLQSNPPRALVGIQAGRPG